MRACEYADVLMCFLMEVGKTVIEDSHLQGLGWQASFGMPWTCQDRRQRAAKNIISLAVAKFFCVPKHQFHIMLYLYFLVYKVSYTYTMYLSLFHTLSTSRL